MSLDQHYADILTMGRSGVDIFPLQVGAHLEDVETFGKFLGGSPTNVVVAAARLVPRAHCLLGVGGGVGIVLGLVLTPAPSYPPSPSLRAPSPSWLSRPSLPESPSWLASRGRDVEAFLVLRDLHGPRMVAAKTTVIAHAKTGDGGGGRGLLGVNGPGGDRQRVRETQAKAVRTHTAL